MIDRKLIKLEKELMDERYPNFKFFKGRLGKLQSVMWRGELRVNSITYKIGISLSDTYPNTRPYVCILDDNFNIQDFDTPHIYKKNICLYTSDGSDNSWKREYKIVDVIERLHDFLNLHQKGKHKDIHKTVFDPMIDLTDSVKYIFDINWFPTNDIRSGYIEFESSPLNANFNYAVKILNFDKVMIHYTNNLYMKDHEHCIKKEVVKWIYLKGEKIDSILKLKRKIDFDKLINRKQGIRHYHNQEITKCVIFTWRDQNVILVNLNDKLSFSNVIKINMDQFFARNKKIIDVDKLETKIISIFGLGSLGSMIAEQLSRAGLSNFILFDFDQFTPENLSRHTLTIEDMFLNKAEAVKKRITKINPLAEVIAFASTQNILYNDELYGFLLDTLKKSDIIICSTGNVESEYDINFILKDLSKEKEIPAIFTAVLGNGFGGRMHRINIGKTPCYQCIKILQESNPKLYKLFTQETFLDYDENKYGIYTEAGIPALNVDINIVASITVKMVLETLLNKPNPIFKFDSYIWGNQMGWEFDEAFQLKDIRFDRVNNCPICGENK